MRDTRAGILLCRSCPPSTVALSPNGTPRQRGGRWRNNVGGGRRSRAAARTAADGAHLRSARAGVAGIGARPWKYHWGAAPQRPAGPD